MTNKERYKQAFSTLHASQPILLEETNMEKTDKRFKMRPALAAGLAAALIVGCMGAAYAADLGGIQETVRMWFGGKEVEAQVTGGTDGGAYQFTIPGTDGEDTVVGGGGVEIGNDGVERPLSAQEVAQEFAHYVEQKEDGTTWLYDHDQSYDITGYLAAGQGKFTLEVDGQAVYYDFDLDTMTHSRFHEATGPVEDYIQLR